LQLPQFVPVLDAGRYLWPVDRFPEQVQQPKRLLVPGFLLVRAQTEVVLDQLCNVEESSPGFVSAARDLTSWGCGRFLGLIYAAERRLSRYSIGLMPPSVSLIRFWLYHLMYSSTRSMNSPMLMSFQLRL
jgi:hypothetical protein